MANNMGFGKRSMLLALHQVSGTIGVLIWAEILAALVVDVFGIFGHAFSMRNLRNALRWGPFYPAQIIVGIFWGWVIWTRFKHRVMLWIWIFPLIVLVLGMLDDSTRFSTIYPGAIVTNYRIMFSTYFGSGCRLDDGCLKQITVTLPFYAAVSYGFGAWLALSFSNRFLLLDRCISGAISMIGVLILPDAIHGFIYGFEKMSWVFIGVAILMASLAVYLIYFGIRTFRILNQSTPSAS